MSLVLACERLISGISASCCAPKMRMAEASWFRAIASPVWFGGVGGGVGWLVLGCGDLGVERDLQGSILVVVMKSSRRVNNMKLMVAGNHVFEAGVSMMTFEIAAVGVFLDPWTQWPFMILPCDLSTFRLSRGPKGITKQAFQLDMFRSVSKEQTFDTTILSRLSILHWGLEMVFTLSLLKVEEVPNCFFQEFSPVLFGIKQISRKVGLQYFSTYREALQRPTHLVTQSETQSLNRKSSRPGRSSTEARSGLKDVNLEGLRSRNAQSKILGTHKAPIGKFGKMVPNTCDCFGAFFLTH